MCVLGWEGKWGETDQAQVKFDGSLKKKFTLGIKEQTMGN